MIDVLHERCPPGCLCTSCAICHAKHPWMPRYLTNEQARAMPLAERVLLRDYWLRTQGVTAAERLGMAATEDERALLDECTGRRGCPAELHLWGCPARGREAHDPPPSTGFASDTIRGLPDPTNLEYRGGGRLGRVLGQTVLFWLGLLVGGLTPGAPYPIALVALGFALLFTGIYYALRR